MSFDTIGAALRRLELSESEQTIYLSLLQHGRSTPRMLADRTGLTRPSVYDQLRNLQAINLVVELSVEGKAYFAAADLKHLEALLTDRIDRLEQSRDQLKDALATMSLEVETVIPHIRFFEGEEGMKQLMKDIMWHDKETLKIFWSTFEMSKIFDEAFLNWWQERRQKRSLKAEVVAVGTKRLSVPFTSKDDKVVFDTKKSLSQALLMIYGTKVAFISSRQEAFGFIVESGEYAKMQSALFDSYKDAL